MGNIRRGTLGLEALHNLTSQEPVRKFHNTDVLTIHEYHVCANQGGKARETFVRWAIDRILPPRLMSKIPGDVWTQHVLNALRDVGAELQRATKEIDDEILRKGQKDTEVRRFNDLIFLLDECLNYIQQHLRTYDKIKSRLGVDELGSIANDTDIVCCMRSDVHLRREYLASREAKDPRFICFMKMAELTVKRLRDRGRLGYCGRR